MEDFGLSVRYGSIFRKAANYFSQKTPSYVLILIYADILHVQANVRSFGILE